MLDVLLLLIEWVTWIGVPLVAVVVVARLIALIVPWRLLAVPLGAIVGLIFELAIPAQMANLFSALAPGRAGILILLGFLQILLLPLGIVAGAIIAASRGYRFSLERVGPHLYNSHGQHIASQVRGRLYAPSGTPIGELRNGVVAVDMRGHYIGGIIDFERLLAQDASKYRSRSFTPPDAIEAMDAFQAPSRRPMLLRRGYHDLDQSVVSGLVDVG